jgi:hypothetical protein
MRITMSPAFHVHFIIREYGVEAGAYQGARARHKFVTLKRAVHRWVCRHQIK